MNTPRGWALGLLAVLAAAGVFAFFRSYPWHGEPSAPAPVTAPAEPREAREEPAVPIAEEPDTVTAAQPELTQVYECKRDGQKVFSDEPCGDDATTREIPQPNTMMPLQRTPARREAE
jgi:hypothetical protein